MSHKLSKVGLGLAAICAVQIGCFIIAPQARADSNPDSPHSGITMDWSGDRGQLRGGTKVIWKTEEPQEIPEPGTVGALLLTGLGMIYYRKKRQLVNE